MKIRNGYVRTKNNTSAKSGVKVEGRFSVLFPILLIPQESGGNWQRHGTGTVSYPHLDVYKRQGLSNYIKMFKDEYFRVSLVNNLIYTGVTVPCTIVIALLLAVALNVGIKGTGLFRTFIFFPNISSMAVSYTHLDVYKRQ